MTSPRDLPRQVSINVGSTTARTFIASWDLPLAAKNLNASFVIELEPIGNTSAAEEMAEEVTALTNVADACTRDEALGRMRCVHTVQGARPFTRYAVRVRRRGRPLRSSPRRPLTCRARVGAFDACGCSTRAHRSQIAAENSIGRSLMATSPQQVMTLAGTPEPPRDLFASEAGTSSLNFSLRVPRHNGQVVATPTHEPARGAHGRCPGPHRQSGLISCARLLLSRSSAMLSL